MTDSEPRCYNVSYILLGLSVLVALLSGGDEDGLPAAIRALVLVPELVRQGELWRLATYTLISSGSLFWTIIYKALLYMQFAHALERSWGTRRFLILYGLAVLVSGIVAVPVLPVGEVLIGGGVGEVVIFFAYGMTFSHQRVLLMFMFPVPVRPLALVVAGGYLLYLMSLGLGGVPCAAGLLCGVGYVLYVNRPRRVMGAFARAMARAAAPAETDDKAMDGMPTEHLERQVRRIVARRMNDERISEGERLIVDTLIRRVDPGKELCAPLREGDERRMCPICEELGVCLRQFLEKRRTIPSVESGEERGL